MNKEQKVQVPELVFIRAAWDKADEEWKAVFANKTVLGESGVSSLRDASRAGQFNRISMRGGLLQLDSERLDSAINAALGHNKRMNLDELRRARTILDERTRALPRGPEADVTHTQNQRRMLLGGVGM